MEINTKTAQEVLGVTNTNNLEISELLETQLALIGGGTGEATPY